MWILIWQGHVAGFEIDQTDTMAPLEEGLAIAPSEWATRPATPTPGPGRCGATSSPDAPVAAIEAAESIAGWVEEPRQLDLHPFFKSAVHLGFRHDLCGRSTALRTSVLMRG